MLLPQGFARTLCLGCEKRHFTGCLKDHHNKSDTVLCSKSGLLLCLRLRLLIKSDSWKADSFMHHRKDIFSSNNISLIRLSKALLANSTKPFPGLWIPCENVFLGAILLYMHVSFPYGLLSNNLSNYHNHWYKIYDCRSLIGFMFLFLCSALFCYPHLVRVLGNVWFIWYILDLSRATIPVYGHSCPYPLFYSSTA